MALSGKLSEWYRLHVAGFDADRKGCRALEQAFAAPIGRVELQWKAWALAQGRQDSTIDSGDGVLGAALSHVTDGVRVESVQPGSPAERTGIRAGDVLAESDSLEVRSIGDYLLAVSDRRVDENLKIRFRRGSSYSIVEATLAPGSAVSP